MNGNLRRRTKILLHKGEQKGEPISKNRTISTAKAAERVILVAVDSTGLQKAWSAADSLAELADLAYSAGAEVVGKVTQKLPAPSKTTYIGKGKLEELLKLKDTLKYESVIVDDELTPQQQQNLADFFTRPR